VRCPSAANHSPYPIRRNNNLFCHEGSHRRSRERAHHCWPIATERGKRPEADAEPAVVTRRVSPVPDSSRVINTAAGKPTPLAPERDADRGVEPLRHRPRMPHEAGEEPHHDVRTEPRAGLHAEVLAPVCIILPVGIDECRTTVGRNAPEGRAVCRPIGISEKAAFQEIRETKPTRFINGESWRDAIPCVRVEERSDIGVVGDFVVDLVEGFERLFWLKPLIASVFRRGS